MKVVFANNRVRIPLNKDYDRYAIKAGSRWPWTFLVPKNKRIKCRPPFPLFMGYAAGFLKKHGYEIGILDGVPVDMPEEEFIERLKEEKPDIIVIETVTHSIEHDLKFYTEVKSIIKGVRLILVGTHATTFPVEIMKDNDVVDYIILGEYDVPLLKLLEAISGKYSLENIKALAYRKSNGGISINWEREYLEDLDELPFIPYELFPYKGAEKPFTAYYYDGAITYSPAAMLMSSRGCPYWCDFCLWTQVFYGNRKYRTFSPKRIIDEVEYLVKNYGIKEVYFDDDDILINKEHIWGIIRELKERKLGIKWSCMGDAMNADEELIKAMAESGCIYFKFGIESGDPRVLKEIGKPLNLEKALKVANWLKKYGIYAHATFMLGLSGETRESMENTMKIANRIWFDYAQLSIATPFPGTRFYNKLVEKGKLRARNWSDFDGTTTAVVETEDLKPQEIEEFRRRMLMSMIFHKIINPLWILRFLRRWILLWRYQGPETALSPIFALINQIKLKFFKQH